MLMQDDQPTPDSPWNYAPESSEVSLDSVDPPVTVNLSVEWTASEFIVHDKDLMWFVGLAIVFTTLAAVVYFITKDIISAVMMVIVGAAFGYIGQRKPHSFLYCVDNRGIKIGSRHYYYSEFKSFSGIQEGAARSLRLLPMKRFMPMVSMYYEPKDEEKILTILSNHLPYEEHKLDAVEQLMHRLRF